MVEKKKMTGKQIRQIKDISDKEATRKVYHGLA